MSRLGLASERISPPLEIRIRTLYNPDLKEVNGILPGLMAIVLAMPALAAALSIAREKEQGSLEGLMATPIQHRQLLVGKVVPYLLIAGLIFMMPPINESGIFYPLYAMPPDAQIQSLLF